MVKAAALLLLGALAVHELRYALAYGDAADSVLAHHGHGYLAVLAPVLGLVIAAGLGCGLLLAAMRRPCASPARTRLRVVWPIAAVGLLGLYTSQELLEGLLTTGHPSGWTGVFGGGGWLAIPLCVAFGGLIACAVRVARLVEGCPGFAPGLTMESLRGLELSRYLVAVGSPARARRPVLAGKGAGRAPPVLFA